MNKNNSLGEKLKLARQRKGFSQKYVYDYFDIKQSTFSSWERGISKPDHSMLFKLCEFYGIRNINEFLNTDNIEEFLENERSFLLEAKNNSRNTANDYTDIIENQITEFEQQLIKTFRELDERGKSTVMECIRFQLEFLHKDNYIPKTIPLNPRHTHKFSMREIRVYTQPAAAGLGNYLDDDSDFQLVQAEAPTIADVGIRISGDSMQPIIENGSIVWVKRCDVVDNGEIGIFILNGNAYCKVLKCDKNGFYLHSTNPEYADIRIGETDTLTVYGKVIM